ncbi:magnesium transporter [Cohnella sp.]|uniref:magnesium transporter n=1 Tax=Cohnella sp. TaxID=1883426 RepID=UPI003562607E
MVKLNLHNRDEYTKEVLQALMHGEFDDFRNWFAELHPTDRVDIYQSVNEEWKESIRQNLSAEHMERKEAADVKTILAQKEDSAGSLMTTEYIAIETNDSVNDVLAMLRQRGRDAETIYYLYVINGGGRLVGVVSLRDLIVADLDANIRDIMSSKAISVRMDTDREEVARMIKKYDFLALPVVTDKGVLVGIVTVDDAMDIEQAETTEDFHKMAKVIQLGKSVKDAGVLFLFRKRIVWLVILVFVNIFSGAGIALFEDTIAASIVLVFFLPLLIDSGGNAGSQSATLMIRAIATGEIKLKDWYRMFIKEVGVAALMGIAMAAAVSILGLYRGGWDIAVVVALTMICTVMLGCLIGMTLPFIFSRMKMDPATASGPLITSLADICGVLIYFSIATWYLGL